MKFSEYLNEHGVFYGFTSMCHQLKHNMITKDLNNLLIPYENISNDFDEIIPQTCKFALHIPKDDMDKSEKLRDVKRRLLTAGWSDLAQDDSIVLFKRSVYISLIQGITGNVIICVH